MSGYIKLHRSLLDWEWYGDINVSRLFVHLILKVNFEEKKWRGNLVKKGQLVTSIKTLSLETGLSLQSIRTALKKLESTNEITIQSTNVFTKIYIRNYRKYQENKLLDNKPANKPTTNDQQTNNKRITTTKEGKEIKKEKNNTKKIYKKKFLDCVFLTDDEYRKLVDDHGEEFTQQCIKRLDLHIPNKAGSPYKDHYRAILSWVVGAVEKDQLPSKKNKMSFRKGKLVESEEQSFEDEIKEALNAICE